MPIQQGRDKYQIESINSKSNVTFSIYVSELISLKTVGFAAIPKQRATGLMPLLIENQRGNLERKQWLLIGVQSILY